MSQSTLNTSLSFLLHNPTLTNETDDLFSQLPLSLPTQPYSQSLGPTQHQIIRMKLRVILEYLGSQVLSKGQMKRVLNNLVSVAGNNKAQEEVMKNVIKMKVMLKYCQVREIVPFLAETILKLVKVTGKNEQ